MDHKEYSNAFLMINGSQLFPIEKSVTKIGRSSENDLVLPYPQISRRHAEIRFTDGGFIIIDMNSTGGTFVNGIKVRQQALNKGDVITLVNLHLGFGMDRYPDSKTVSLYQNPKGGLVVDKVTKTLVTMRSK